MSCPFSFTLFLENIPQYSLGEGSACLSIQYRITYLLGHQLTSTLVGLGVMDPDTAEHGKSLHCLDIFLVESFSIKLKVMGDISRGRQRGYRLTLFIS